MPTNENEELILKAFEAITKTNELMADIIKAHEKELDRLTEAVKEHRDHHRISLDWLTRVNSVLSIHQNKIEALEKVNQ